MPRPHHLLFGLVAHVLALGSMVLLVPFLADLPPLRGIDTGPTSGAASALAIDLALLLAFAATHSLLARRSIRERLFGGLPEGLRTSAFSLVAGLQMAALLALWRPLPAPVWSVDHPVARALIWSLFGLGWTVVLVGFLTLRDGRLFGLDQALASARGGTVPRQGLNREGIYRWVRHPLYSGTILALWATPGMSQGHLLLAAVFTAYILIGCRYEERDLERLHGEVWRSYRDAVPAFLPRPRRAAESPPD